MATETPMVVEVDCTTGESITRAMTKEEQETQALVAADAAKRHAEEEAAAKAKADAQASALTKLTALGLSVEEVKAIIS
jgi:hypothetical protein